MNCAQHKKRKLGKAGLRGRAADTCLRVRSPDTCLRVRSPALRQRRSPRTWHRCCATADARRASRGRSCSARHGLCGLRPNSDTRKDAAATSACTRAPPSDARVWRAGPRVALAPRAATHGKPAGVATRAQKTKTALSTHQTSPCKIIDFYQN